MKKTVLIGYDHSEQIAFTRQTAQATITTLESQDHDFP